MKLKRLFINVDMGTGMYPQGSVLVANNKPLVQQKEIALMKAKHKWHPTIGSWAYKYEVYEEDPATGKIPELEHMRKT